MCSDVRDMSRLRKMCVRRGVLSTTVKKEEAEPRRCDGGPPTSDGWKEEEVPPTRKIEAQQQTFIFKRRNKRPVLLTRKENHLNFQDFQKNRNENIMLVITGVLGSGSARQPDCLPSTRSGTGGTPDSSQRSWSGCRLWRRGPKRWEGQVRRDVSCETCCEMGWLLSAQRDNTTPVNILIFGHTHVRVTVKCAQTCATRQDWEKCACDEVFCPHTPSLARESQKTISCKRNSLKQSAKSPCMILVILPLWCLGVHAIESLDVRVATNFVRIMKRKI